MIGKIVNDNFIDRGGVERKRKTACLKFLGDFVSPLAIKQVSFKNL